MQRECRPGAAALAEAGTLATLPDGRPTSCARRSGTPRAIQHSALTTSVTSTEFSVVPGTTPPGSRTTAAFRDGTANSALERCEIRGGPRVGPHRCLPGRDLSALAAVNPRG